MSEPFTNTTPPQAVMIYASNVRVVKKNEVDLPKVWLRMPREVV